MNDSMEEILSNAKNVFWILCTVSLIVCSPIFVPGVFIGHDSLFHFARIAGTETALADGQIPPLVSPNLCNGFGYAWNAFYSPLSAYLPVIVNFFIKDFSVSFKLYIFMTVFLSGLFMYNFVKCVFTSRCMAMIAAIIYITAPYRIVEIFTRCALGEMTVFLFLPLIFHGLYSLFCGDGKKNYLLTVGIAGVVLSHLLSVLIILPFVLAYAIFHLYKIRSKKIFFGLLINFIFSFALSCFFVVPLLEEKKAAEYLIFQAGTMFTPEFSQTMGTYLYQLLLAPFQSGGSLYIGDADFATKEMTFAIGLQILVPLLIIPFVWPKLTEGYIKKTYILWLGMGLVALFVTTIYFPWVSVPAIFSVVQFPWRYLVIAIFTLSIIAGYNIYKSVNDFEIKHFVVMIFLVLVYLQPLINKTAINFDMNFSMEKFMGIDHIGDNEIHGRLSWGTALMEYLPIKAFNNREYIGKRSQGVIVLTGGADITEEKKEGTHLAFSVNNTLDNTILELPFIYYLGYEVKITNQEETKLVQPQESKNGFLAVEIPPSVSGGLISVKYSGTKLTKPALWVSIAGFFLFCVYIWLVEKNKFSWRLT